MKANELRVGNYIIINTGTNEPFCMDYDAMHDTFLDDDWEDLQPIILTEEWLINFGFKMVVLNAEGLAEWNEWRIKDFEIFSTGSHESCKNDLCFGTFDFKVKYVHQLQNLYFALTGEELTIK